MRYSEQKSNYILTKKRESFKEYFLNEFGDIKSKMKYYYNLVSNEITSIDSLILIANMDDINEYIKPINKMHTNLLLKKIKQIKKGRNKFEQILVTINMFDYLDNFDSNGIYTFKQYNNKIKNINDLKKITNNKKGCLTIFNSMMYINEGQQGT